MIARDGSRATGSNHRAAHATWQKSIDGEGGAPDDALAEPHEADIRKLFSPSRLEIKKARLPSPTVLDGWTTGKPVVRARQLAQAAALSSSLPSCRAAVKMPAMSLAPPQTGLKTAHRYGSYAAWKIAPRASSPIDLMWRSRIDGSTQARHILLPFVEPSLILRCRLGARGTVTDYDVRLSRACPDGGEYLPKAHEEQFAVRLAPEHAAMFDLDPAVNEDIAMEALPPSLLRMLGPARHHADAGRFEAAWQAMAENLSKAEYDGRDRASAQAMSILRGQAGRLAPAQLNDVLGVSARHLRRTFSERFGASPRAIARRLRLTAALIAGEEGRASDWAGVAAEHGYSDQSHLIRECRAILGKTPARLVAQRRKMAVSSNP